MTDCLGGYISNLDNQMNGEKMQVEGAFLFRFAIQNAPRKFNIAPESLEIRPIFRGELLNFQGVVDPHDFTPFNTWFVQDVAKNPSFDSSKRFKRT